MTSVSSPAAVPFTVRDVDVHTDTTVAAIEQEHGTPVVRTTDGMSLSADVVLVTGVRPDTALAVSAGITLSVRGAIAVDRAMRTSARGPPAAASTLTATAWDNAWAASLRKVHGNRTLTGQKQTLQ